MSCADHGKARQLVRLRDLTLDAALRALGEAQGAMAAADVAHASATADREIATRRLGDARSALADAPIDVPTRLARIDLALMHDGEALAALDEARQVRDDAAAVLDIARADHRRAQARLEAITARAEDLKRALARADEERAAIEAEEGLTAMRSAA